MTQKKAFPSTAACACLLLALLLPLSAEDITFSAASMSGTSGKKNAQAILEGGANVLIGSLSINSESMELSGDDYRFVSATGGVTGEDTERGFTFSASTMTHDREKEISEFRGAVQFHDSENDVEISAGMLSYDRNNETIFMQIGIVLTKNDMRCTSTFAVYRRNESYLELSGAPLVINEGNEFKANRIFVDLDTEKITMDGAVSGTMKDEDEGDGNGGNAPPPQEGDRGGPPPNGGQPPVGNGDGAPPPPR